MNINLDLGWRFDEVHYLQSKTLVHASNGILPKILGDELKPYDGGRSTYLDTMNAQVRSVSDASEFCIIWKFCQGILQEMEVNVTHSTVPWMIWGYWAETRRITQVIEQRT